MLRFRPRIINPMGPADAQDVADRVNAAGMLMFIAHELLDGVSARITDEPYIAEPLKTIAENLEIASKAAHDVYVHDVESDETVDLAQHASDALRHVGSMLSTLHDLSMQAAIEHASDEFDINGTDTLARRTLRKLRDQDSQHIAPTRASAQGERQE